MANNSQAVRKRPGSYRSKREDLKRRRHHALIRVLAEKDPDTVIKYSFDDAKSGAADRHSGEEDMITSYGHTGYNKWKYSNG